MNHNDYLEINRLFVYGQDLFELNKYLNMDCDNTIMLRYKNIKYLKRKSMIAVINRKELDGENIRHLICMELFDDTPDVRKILSSKKLANDKNNVMVRCVLNPKALDKTATNNAIVIEDLSKINSNKIVNNTINNGFITKMCKTLKRKGVDINKFESDSEVIKEFMVEQYKSEKPIIVKENEEEIISRPFEKSKYPKIFEYNKYYILSTFIKVKEVITK